MTRLLALALLLGSACSRGDGRTTTPQSRAERCTLADGRIVFELPIGPEHALAVAPDGCMYVDESTHAVRSLSIASLATDAEGADLLRTNADEFFRSSGLLGAEPEIVGRGLMMIAGEQTAALAWDAQIEELGEVRATTGALRRGGDWIIVVVLAERSDDEGRRGLLRVAAELSAPTR
ncbi:MAG: hypothetical protein KF901_21180 [Myxococcales bacterium]|nr:hypothetical protein [Myxococcales bacterium]